MLYIFAFRLNVSQHNGLKYTIVGPWACDSSQSQLHISKMEIIPPSVATWNLIIQIKCLALCLAYRATISIITTFCAFAHVSLLLECWLSSFSFCKILEDLAEIPFFPSGVIFSQSCLIAPRLIITVYCIMYVNLPRFLLDSSWYSECSILAFFFPSVPLILPLDHLIPSYHNKLPWLSFLLLE